MNCKVIQWEGDIELLSAAGNGDTTAVDKLIKQGRDVNTRDEERKTPLMYAAVNGHLSVVKLLLDAGASVNAKDYRKRTASELAECKRHFEILLLIEGITCPYCGIPAVHYACCSHFLGSINDCGLSTPLDFGEDVAELCGLIQSLDEDVFEEVTNKCPSNLRELFEAARNSDDYWTEDEEISIQVWDARGEHFHFHRDGRGCAERIKGKAECGIAWLNDYLGFKT